MVDGGASPPYISTSWLNISPLQLDAVFHALGDATCRQMLARLAEQTEQTVSQLAEPFDVASPPPPHQGAGERWFVQRGEVRGRTHWCRLRPEPLADAHAWLTSYQRFWRAAPDVLEARC